MTAWVPFRHNTVTVAIAGIGELTNEFCSRRRRLQLPALVG
jgi:hypothetical protein